MAHSDFSFCRINLFSTWINQTMIKGNHIGLFIIYSLIYVTNLYGQQNIVQFEHINLEEGLSQGSVYCVLQDQKGFLWFGTQDGLNKYDGYQFTIYRHNKGDSSSLSDNCINAIQEDNDGYLWIGTLSGGLTMILPIHPPSTAIVLPVSMKIARKIYGLERLKD